MTRKFGLIVVTAATPQEVVAGVRYSRTPASGHGATRPLTNPGSLQLEGQPTGERINSRLITTVLATVLCLNVPLLSAEEDKNKEEATVAFQNGVERFHAKEFESAVAFFRSAYALSPTWKLHFNIGQCEAALKRYGLALDAFEAYMVAGGDEIPPDRAEAVLAEIDRLTRLVGALDVVAPDGCEVMVDGVRRAETPLLGQIRVSAGIRLVEVKQGATIVWSQSVKITGQGKARVEVTLERVQDQEQEVTEELTTAAPEDLAETQGAINMVPESQAKDRPALIPLGWSIGGTGVAVLIAGAVTGGVALSQYRELEKACPKKVCTTSSDFELKAQVDSLKVATDVLLPLGAALVVTGIVITLVGERREKRTAFRVAPIVTTDLAGLFVEGRF